MSVAFRSEKNRDFRGANRDYQDYLFLERS